MNDVPLYQEGYERYIEYKGDTYTAVNRVKTTDVYTYDGDLFFVVPIGMQTHMIKAVIEIYYDAYQEGRNAGRVELRGEFNKLMGQTR